MRLCLAYPMVVLGLLMIAGGEFFLSGVGLLLLGLYLSGYGSGSGRASEILIGIVAILGALGVAAVFVLFAWQRLT